MTLSHGPGKGIHIVPESSLVGEWSPTWSEIGLPRKGTKGYEHLPLVLAHEIAHIRESHSSPSYLESPMAYLVTERDAWVSAVRRMPSEEIDLDFVNSTFGTYVREVRDHYGEGSPQFEEAKRMRRELMNYVRERKGSG